MGQEWHASKDERLLREARRLLRLALTHTNLRESPFALMPALDARHSLDENLARPFARRCCVPALLDEVRHAMRMTWVFSNVADIPVFSAWFALVLIRIETRVLGHSETVLFRPEPKASDSEVTDGKGTEQPV